MKAYFTKGPDNVPHRSYVASSDDTEPMDDRIAELEAQNKDFLEACQRVLREVRETLDIGASPRPQIERWMLEVLAKAEGRQ